MLIAALALAVAAPAGAYWGSGAAAGGQGGALAGTVPQVTAVTAVIADPPDITVDWSPVAAGSATVHYLVTRDDGVATTVVCDSQATSLLASECVDGGPPAGTFTYRVTALVESWSGPASQPSNEVTTDSIAPTLALGFPAASGRYNDASWNAGCGSAICGTAADNVRVDEVEVSIGRAGGGYWDGAGGFTDPAPSFHEALGTTSWSYSFPAAGFPAEGAYTIAARATDEAGNQRTVDLATAVIDRTAPDLTLTTPVTGSSGSSPTPILGGAGGAAAGDDGTVEVTIRAGGAVAQTITSPVSNGQWTATAAPLAEGAYTATATQRDAAGNQTTTTASAFTIDRTGPAVTLTTPAPGAFTTTMPVLSGAAGDADGDAAAVTVRIYDGTGTGGAIVQTQTVGRVGTVWSTSASPALALGTYTATATQVDAAGNITTSAGTTFTVDTAAPPLTLTSPVANSFTANPTPTISGAAGDAANDSTTVTVTIYNGAGTGGTVAQSFPVTRAGPAWSAVPAALAEGTYTATASQTDAAGNTTTTAGTTFTIDRTAPVVTLTSPAAGAFTTTTPTLSGSAGAGLGDASTIALTIYAGTGTGGAVVQTTSATRSGAAWSKTATALAQGTYTVTATQADAAGNTTTTAGTTFTVDTLAPGVTLTSPAANAFVGTATPTLSGAAGAGASDLTTVTLRIYAGTGTGGALLQTVPVTRSGAAWSATASTLVPGTYTATASQADAAGNQATTAGTTFTVDLTAPPVTLTSPAPGAYVTTTKPTLSGTAGSATGDSATVTVKIYAGTGTGGTLTQTVAVTRSGAAWSKALTTALAQGTFTATATQADAAGNSTTTGGTTFIVDSVAPVATVTTPAANAFTNNTSPTLAGAAGNLSGDGSIVTVKVYAGTTATGIPVQTLTTARSGTAWSTTATPPLTAGAYTLTASQTDAAGNTGTSAARTFTVDLTAPVVTLAAPAAGATTNAKPVFSGAAGSVTGDSTTITIRIYSGTGTGGTLTQTQTTTRTSGTWTKTTTTSLAGGTYTATATQADSAGNSSTTGGTTFTVDATGPTVTGAVLGGALADGTATAATRFIGQGKPFYVYANATDAGSGVAGATANVTNIVTGVTALPLAACSGTCTFGSTTYAYRSALQTAKTPLTAGTAPSFTVTATDAVGNASSATTGSSTIVDNTAPTTTITSPANNATNVSRTPTLSGTMSALAGTGDTVALTVTVLDGGSPVRTLTTTTTATTWSATWTGAVLGATHAYTAQVTSALDAAGNAGTASALVTFTTGP